MVIDEKIVGVRPVRIAVVRGKQYDGSRSLHGTIASFKRIVYLK